MSEHITFREGPRKAALRSSFYHPSRCEESQERGNHEPLVSLRRPGSAEQAQLKKKETQKKKRNPVSGPFSFFLITKWNTLM